ncbi:MAG: gliding motility-associated C-terminal domain-containing protein, partial [Cytophagaceae bacterium]
VSSEVMDFRIPNVITPNGDGKNDSFKIIGLSAYPESTLMIYNRWGNEVWHSTGISYRDQWTGEGLNEGTYYYVLKIKDKTGNWQTFTGSVALLR